MTGIHLIIQYCNDPRSAQSRLDRKKLGAGEGIRTLVPDLGKVVLYP